VPIASAASTITSSIGPCVSASTTGSTPAAATMARACAAVRSPAASGSAGLLMRSISTSSIWLMPTM
jgi:hypothetical protein